MTATVNTPKKINPLAALTDHVRSSLTWKVATFLVGGVLFAGIATSSPVTDALTKPTVCTVGVAGFVTLLIVATKSAKRVAE